LKHRVPDCSCRRYGKFKVNFTEKPVLVFADSEGRPAYQAQMSFLAKQAVTWLAEDASYLTDTDPPT